MRTRTLLTATMLLAVVTAGCGDDDSSSSAPTSYDIVASAPRFVVPSAGLPAQTIPQPSNNNVDIIFHDTLLFMAWRTAPSHFASAETTMHIVSSTDGGLTWSFEHTIALGSDVREPRFLSFNGTLQLMFFQAGTDPAAFEPKRLLRTRRLGLANWTDVEVVADEGEVPWDVKVHNGRAYRTSYEGEHNPNGEVGDIRVFFKSSTDGLGWNVVDGQPFVYRGGVSESAFEFADDGALWVVMRNEDGDQTGFGSHLCRAPANALSAWDCATHSNPERYDSPKLFSHAGEIYLIARRDIGGPYDEGATALPFADQKIQYLIDYSLRPKRSALYRIDKATRTAVYLLDLPGDGDTAFPSVRQTGPHTFLVANYTSPLDQPDISWLEGQNSARGTQIYLLTLQFVPRVGPAATPTSTSAPTPTSTPNSAGQPSVALQPVFAAPSTPLAITWPVLPDLVGLLDLGDGAMIGPNVVMHGYADPGIFRVHGSVRSGGVTTSLSGAVARTTGLAVTPLRRFTLTQPRNGTVQTVIRGVIPAFYWAFSADTLAIGIDPTAQATFPFTDVTVATVGLHPDGTVTSEPVALNVELTGSGTTASGQFVGLRQVVFSGSVSGDAAAPQLGSPMTMDAQIVIADLVGVLRHLGGFDETSALQFLSGLFGFDPASPPETAAFEGQFALQPAS